MYTGGMKKSVKKTEKKITTNHLAFLIEKIAEGVAKVYAELAEFKMETRENFAKVRRDILDIRDIYATKEELGKVAYRVKVLEQKKK